MHTDVTLSPNMYACIVLIQSILTAGNKQLVTHVYPHY